MTGQEQDRDRAVQGGVCSPWIRQKGQGRGVSRGRHDCHPYHMCPKGGAEVEVERPLYRPGDRER